MTEKTFLQRVAERDAANQPPPPPPATPIVMYREGDNRGRDRAYAESALRTETNLVANAINGTRNHTLNTAAFNLARFITDGILTHDEVTTTLAGAAAQAGLDHTEIAATLRSGLAGGATKHTPGGAVPPPRITIDTPTTAQQAATNYVETIVDEPQMHPIWGSHPPVDGAAYLFDTDDTTTALWGHDEHNLWAEGEALMIAGGMGLGKTTLAGQIVRAQLGLTDTVLGLPVAPIDGPILYLAMDRPRQIRRSMLRQFEPHERDIIAGRLLIRPGPPLADLAVRPTLLAEMAKECGAAVVYIDSLKDAAVGLSGDEVGAAYNRARQYALANNVQVCELHHLIKRNPMGGAPNSVADVYGSNWLTAGAGSVIMLTGDPGDPIIEFRHVKQPHTEVGPYRLMHDQTAGHFTIDHEVDLLALAVACGAEGLTPQGAAAAIFEREKPTRAQVEKARRRLDKLVTGGQLIRVEGIKGGVSGGQSANYFLAK